MKTTPKYYQVRVRANQTDGELISALAEQMSIAQADVASMILHAALKPIHDNGGKFTIPLHFDFSSKKTNGEA